MKSELVKAMMMALLFSLLISTYFVVIGFGVYPGPDEKTTKDAGMNEKVESTSIGWYYEENWNYYEHAGHSSYRWKSWPSEFKGNMKCHWKASSYDMGEYEFEPGVNYYSGIGYYVYATWVSTWTYSKFTNFLGGVWSRQTTAYIHAFPF